MHLFNFPGSLLAVGITIKGIVLLGFEWNLLYTSLMSTILPEFQSETMQRDASANDDFPVGGWSSADTVLTLHRLGQLNTLRLRQNGHHFPDDIFNCIFLDENVWISIKIRWSLFLNNIPALVQAMASRWPGDRPLSELMMVSLLMHICVTQPQFSLDMNAYVAPCPIITILLTHWGRVTHICVSQLGHHWTR